MPLKALVIAPADPSHIQRQRVNTLIRAAKDCRDEMLDKGMVSAGGFLVLAGLVGLLYGAGVNLQGMMARGASDYSFIGAYITEWTLVLLAGLVLAISGARKR